MKTIALSLIAATTLLAAPPSAGDIEKQVVIPKITKEKVNNDIPNFAPKSSQEKSLEVKLPIKEVTSTKAIKPAIEGFDFIGNDSISDSRLLEVAKSYIGKDLNPETLFELQNILTRFYQSKGFKKARAYAFAENIKKGVITYEIRARDEKGHQLLMSKKGYIRPDMDEKTFLKDLGYALEKKEPKTSSAKPIPTKKQSTAKVAKAYVTDIVYEGNEHILKENLDALLKSYLGKSYTFEELKKITSVVTKHYREKGYFVARAYVPQHAIKNGTFTIAIIEGNYGKFELSNNSLVSDEKVQGVLDAIKDANIISTNTIERAMLLINDTPGANVVKADIMPGNKVGTSDFLIKTEATNPYSAYILGDNYGSKYTGRYRINLGLSANSPLGYGDKLSFNGVMSTTSDLKNGKIAYSFPLMSNGLRGELSASRTTYSLAKEYAALDAFGTVTTLEAGISYPIIRTRQENLSATLSYALKNIKDEILATQSKKEADVVNLGMNYERSCMLFGLPSNTTASLTLSHGNLDSPNNLNTDGSYTKLSGSFEKGLQFNPTYSITTSLRFQKALSNKNLDGSEDFSLGGAYGVRAFPDGEHSAENGYILGAELFYTLPSLNGINHKASIFVDTGYAKMQKDNGTSPSRQLSDIGFGYQASYKSFFVKAQVARVIGGEQSVVENKDSTRALLQIGWLY